MAGTRREALLESRQRLAVLVLAQQVICALQDLPRAVVRRLRRLRIGDQCRGALSVFFRLRRRLCALGRGQCPGTIAVTQFQLGDAQLHRCVVGIGERRQRRFGLVGRVRRKRAVGPGQPKIARLLVGPAPVRKRYREVARRDLVALLTLLQIAMLRQYEAIVGKSGKQRVGTRVGFGDLAFAHEDVQQQQVQLTVAGLYVQGLERIGLGARQVARGNRLVSRIGQSICLRLQRFGALRGHLQHKQYGSGEHGQTMHGGPAGRPGSRFAFHQTSPDCPEGIAWRRAPPAAEWLPASTRRAWRPSCAAISASLAMK